MKNRTGGSTLRTGNRGTRRAAPSAVAENLPPKLPKTAGELPLIGMLGLLFSQHRPWFESYFDQAVRTNKAQKAQEFTKRCKSFCTSSELLCFLCSRMFTMTILLGAFLLLQASTGVNFFSLKQDIEIGSEASKEAEQTLPLVSRY